LTRGSAGERRKNLRTLRIRSVTIFALGCAGSSYPMFGLPWPSTWIDTVTPRKRLGPIARLSLTCRHQSNTLRHGPIDTAHPLSRAPGFRGSGAFSVRDCQRPGVAAVRFDTSTPSRLSTSGTAISMVSPRRATSSRRPATQRQATAGRRTELKETADFTGAG
jgi:hypothetical protein